MIDFSTVTDIMFGNQQVTQIEDSLGNVLWSSSPAPPPPTPDYFYVEDITGEPNTLSIIKNRSSAPAITVYCSTDKSNWTSMGTTSTTAITATIPANSKLYLKATANAWSNNAARDYNKIFTTGEFNVGGCILSLLKGDNYEGTLPNYNYNFFSLFVNSSVVDASKLLFPSNTTIGCYYSLFNNCRSLTTPPITLPALSAANYAYDNMFNTNISLTSAPVIEATSAGDYALYHMYYDCYLLTSVPDLKLTSLGNYTCGEMFYACTSLTTAPELPATTLAQSCYNYMFSGCTALTTAPALPATTLVDGCYKGLFYNCSKVNSVITYANDISATSCLTGWLNNVSATGDFYNMGGATYPTGTNGIPSGWTEHTSL